MEIHGNIQSEEKMNNWIYDNPDPLTEGMAPEGKFEKYDGISAVIFTDSRAIPPLHIRVLDDARFYFARGLLGLARRIGFLIGLFGLLMGRIGRSATAVHDKLRAWAIED